MYFALSHATRHAILIPVYTRIHRDIRSYSYADVYLLLRLRDAFRSRPASSSSCFLSLEEYPRTTLVASLFMSLVPHPCMVPFNMETPNVPRVISNYMEKKSVGMSTSFFVTLVPLIPNEFVLIELVTILEN